MNWYKKSQFISYYKTSGMMSNIAKVPDAAISAVGNFFINLTQGIGDLFWIGLARTDRIPRFLAKMLAAGPAAVWRGLEVLLSEPEHKGMKPYAPTTKFLTRLAAFLNLRRPEDLKENAKRIYEDLLKKKGSGIDIPEDILNFFKNKGKMKSSVFGEGAIIAGDFVISQKALNEMKELDITKSLIKKIKTEIPHVKGKAIYDAGEIWPDIPEIAKGGFVSAHFTRFYVQIINEVPVIVNVK